MKFFFQKRASEHFRLISSVAIFSHICEVTMRKLMVSIVKLLTTNEIAKSYFAIDPLS